MIILRFVHCSGAIEELILFDSNGGQYSHVEAVTPNGKYLGAHTTGVAALPMDYDKDRFSREKFLLLPANKDMSAKFYHYLNAVIGEPYDFGAISSFVSHFDARQKHHVICSALQTLALRACNYLPIPLPVLAHRISVRDLELGLAMRPDIKEILKNDPIFIDHING